MIPRSLDQSFQRFQIIVLRHLVESVTNLHELEPTADFNGTYCCIRPVSDDSLITSFARVRRARSYAFRARGMLSFVVCRDERINAKVYASCCLSSAYFRMILRITHLDGLIRSLTLMWLGCMSCISQEGNPFMRVGWQRVQLVDCPTRWRFDALPRSDSPRAEQLIPTLSKARA